MKQMLTISESKDIAEVRTTLRTFANWKRDETSVSGRSSLQKEVERVDCLTYLSTKKGEQNEDVKSNVNSNWKRDETSVSGRSTLLNEGKRADGLTYKMTKKGEQNEDVK